MRFNFKKSIVNLKINNSIYFVKNASQIIKILKKIKNPQKIEIYIVNPELSDSFLNLISVKKFLLQNTNVILFTRHKIRRLPISMAWDWRFSLPQKIEGEIWHWLDSDISKMEIKILIHESYFDELNINFELMTIYQNAITLKININENIDYLSVDKNLIFSKKVRNINGSINILIESNEKPIAFKNDSRQMSLGIKNFRINDKFGNCIFNNSKNCIEEKFSEYSLRKKLHAMNFYYVNSTIHKNLFNENTETCGSVMSNGVFYTHNNTPFFNELGNGESRLKYFKSYNI